MCRAVIVLAAVCVALIGSERLQQAGAQEKGKLSEDGGTAKVAEEGKTGLTIGEKAPTIKLIDQDGKERSLDELLHEGTVAVVFFRSASW